MPDHSLLVVGGTGQLGSRVVALLAERGQHVRCLVRPATDASALRSLGVEVVRGDLVQPPTLASACAGVDTVVVTATAIARLLAGAKRPSLRETDEVGMTHLVRAAEDAGVERFVYLSYAGLDDALGSPLDRAKLAVERRLASSSMRSVVVRPDSFQEVHLAPLGRFDLAAGKVAIFGRGDLAHRWVAVEDVARLVAAVSLEADPPAVVEFGGPELLSRNETVAVAERLTGRKLSRQRVPRVVARTGMRLLDRRNEALASIFGLGLLQDLVPVTWDDAPLRVRGIEPRTATAWLTKQAATLSGLLGATQRD